MTDDLVKAAREALAGVTEGPWRVTECGDYWVEHNMTWNPPPEKDRPHYYKCLGLIAIQEPDFVWTECVWDEDDHVWYSTLDACDLEEPVAFAPLPDEAGARIEALARRAAEAEARALRYKSERNGLERRVTDVQRQTTASEEAERRIVNQREEIKRLQEIVSHYMRMLQTGEAAPEPVRYVWVVEDDETLETCRSEEEAKHLQKEWQKITPHLPVTITRFVEAPE
jgi:hypothetical protein